MLALQRCLNHDSREAVCRCPGCQNFFCRECVVTFESRLLCANCLAAASETPERQEAGRFGVGTCVLAGLGLLTAWLFFYLAGWTVLQFGEHAPPGFLVFSVPGFLQ